MVAQRNSTLIPIHVFTIRSFTIVPLMPVVKSPSGEKRRPRTNTPF